MCLTVALDLGHFVEGFPTNAVFCIVTGQGFSIGRVGLHREHNAVAHVAVVCDGQHFTASSFFVICHPLPQVFRVEALRSGIRYDLACLITVAPVQHVAVEVVAVLGRCPFVTDHCSKATRVIVFFRDIDVLVPHGLLKFPVQHNIGNVSL